MGTRAASSPPVVLDSGGRNDDCAGSENSDRSAQSSQSSRKEDGEVEDTGSGCTNTGSEGKMFNLCI